MNYDVIVLGTGGVGSAAMYHLARRGLRVLGLDRFPPAHDRGSSHGESRVIRRSYFEHPSYVPLVNEAYKLWDDLSGICGTPLLHQTGLLYFGNPNGPVIRGVLDSAQQHRLPVEQLAPTDAKIRFPQFEAPEQTTALFEADAGYLLVEECVAAYIEQAVSLGADHRHGETILRWSAGDSVVAVETDHERYECAKLVIAAGLPDQ